MKYKIFWGGIDVNPALYNEVRGPYTQTPNLKRDEYESKLARELFEKNIPCIGVCRGAQLLNVLNGGKLYQHVENHGRYHKMEDVRTGEQFTINSTHHQMMVPGPDAQTIGIAPFSCESWDHKQNNWVVLPFGNEVIWYPKTKSLCIQWHPEWMPKESEAMRWLDKLTNKLLGFTVEFIDNSTYYGEI